MTVVPLSSKPPKTSLHPSSSKGLMTSFVVELGQPITATPMLSRLPCTEMHHTSKGAVIDLEIKLR